MNNSWARAPITLLLDTELSPAAKLLWMLLQWTEQASAPRSTTPVKRLGLAYKTVTRARTQLAAEGWYQYDRGTRGHVINRTPSAALVRVPARLLVDRRVGIHGRILFGQLQCTLGFRHLAGQFTYNSLRQTAGSSLPTLRRAVEDLVQAGWLQIIRANRLAPTQFVLSDPVAARAETSISRFRRRLTVAPYRGEALMREYLSLLIDTEAYEDDAAPGFLVNPLTEERLQLDRFYPPSVAFEYNGPQHYGATERFSQEEAAKQRGRDYMKLGICVTRGITLIVVHFEDLRLDSMRSKIGSVLPLRNFDGQERLISSLEAASRRYRLAARRHRAEPPGGAASLRTP